MTRGACPAARTRWLLDGNPVEVVRSEKSNDATFFSAAHRPGESASD